MRKLAIARALNHAGTSAKKCALVGGALVCAVLASCAVDDRALLTRSSLGESGGANGGSGNSPGLGSSGDSQWSEAGSDEPLLVPCVYSGDTISAGCETLVKNPGFTSNVASWTAEPSGISEGWNEADAEDDHHSGSLAVLNLNYNITDSAKLGINGGAARQCVPVTAGNVYDLAADIFVPMGQGAGFEGSYTSAANLSVFYYEDASCEGRTLSNFTSTPVTQTDTWVHVTGSTTAPKESQSMVVRLATLKPFRQVQFEARFDNVFVRERAPQ